MEYLSDLLNEAGRLGFSLDELSRDKSGRSVASELLKWHSSRDNAGFAQLYSWQNVDAKQMATRLAKDHHARPRIEVTARITKRDNLSVVWHPSGWKQPQHDWSNVDEGSNVIAIRKEQNPSDFIWFQGDEKQYGQSRASNELMYIRGVGSLNPTPRDEYGDARFARCR
jgi:hypothetical protein